MGYFFKIFGGYCEERNFKEEGEEKAGGWEVPDYLDLVTQNGFSH